MKIEPAKQADLQALAALWHDGWHLGHGAIAPAALARSRILPEFEARCRARLGQTRVARGDAGLIGFYMIDGDELYQFYVDAAYQGTGAADILMRSAEAELKGRRAWLACSVGNNRAARFYEKSGWRRGAVETYVTETAEGPQDVTIWRFEKDLR